MSLSKTSPMPTSKEAVTIYLTEEAKAKLLKIAKQEQRSMAFIGERIINEGIARWEKEQAGQENEETKS